MIVVGGRGGFTPSDIRKSAEWYDPSDESWRVTGDMNRHRMWHSASALRFGKVLVAGGTVDGTTSLNNSELYDALVGT